jgi:N-methylhydantoinase A
MALFAAEDRDGIKQRFDAVHNTRYGYSALGERAEIVSLRSATTGLMRKPAVERIAVGSAQPDTAAFAGNRAVYFGSAGAFIETPTFNRGKLKAGNRISGPALIEEHASTTVVHPNDQLEVDAFGNLDITIWRS